MAFSNFEMKRYEKIMNNFLEKRRPPIDIREEVDLCYRIHNYSIEIFEIRPLWDNPNQKVEVPIAKTTYIKKYNNWKIYWQRADLKWHRYDPDPEVDILEEFIAIVDNDDYCCFWG